MNKTSKITQTDSKTVSKLGYIVKFIFLQLIVTTIGLPIIVWKLFISRINWSFISQFLSRYARKILEFRKTRHAIGLNLASILLILSLIQLPFTLSQNNSGNVEITLVNSQQISTTTENTFQMPVTGYISQYFSGFHRGIDIAGNDNTDIYPIASGKVVEVAYSPFGYGLSIVIDHGNNYISRYAHLWNINVVLNQEVSKNTVLGNVGSTGWSTGPHLHLEVFNKTTPIDPLAYVSKSFQANSIAINSKKAYIASENLNQEVIASMSAQVEHRQLASNFTDPNDIIFSGTNLNK